jgi:catechol 2,3-dioxygenase-like lactoylglutathione lyase family enzyme
MLDMRSLSFDHIHFTVKDLDEAIEFYKRLGFTRVERMEHGGESAQLKTSDGELTVDLQLAKATDNPGYNHFAMTVDDLDRVVEELRGQDMAVDGTVYVQATRRRIATLRDPSGFLIQLVERENTST